MAVWYLNDGELTNENLNPLPNIGENFMVEPLPLSFWRTDPDYNDGKPFHILLGIAETLGAFKNVASLTRVRIPESVKYIGASAFKGTSLTSVKIAADCIFSPSSFPEECVIERYGMGEFVPLYDRNGRLILDKTGQKILVRRRENG